MYKNYIFDLYGTLADIKTDEDNMMVWEKLALFYGYYGALYQPEELKKSYKKLATISNGKENQEIQIETIFNRMYKDKGVQADESLVLHTCQLFRVTSTEHIQLYDGAKDMLAKLHNSGKKVYLLSNAQKAFTAYELFMLDILRYFDGIMLSSEYGIQKPELKFFTTLIEKYHLNPKESIMIGNDPICDIAGAKKAGLDTYYIHSDISPDCTEDIDATYVQMEMDIGKLCNQLEI